MKINFTGIVLVALINPFQVGAAELRPLPTNVVEQQVSKIFPGRITGFKVSPDGRRVVYLAWAEGHPTHLAEAEEGDSGNIVYVLDGEKSDPYLQNYSAQFPNKILSETRFSPDGKQFIPLAKDCIFSPDSRQIAAIEGSSYVTVNGQGVYSRPNTETTYSIPSSIKNAPDYRYTTVQKSDNIRIESVSFSPDSRFLAIAVKAHTQPPVPNYFVVIAGREGKKYSLMYPTFQHSSGRGFVQFSPDSERYAYSAQTGGLNARDIPAEHFVVVNDKEGRHYAGIGDDLEFSPDSQHLLYVAKLSEQKLAVVIDDVQGKIYDAWNIGYPVFSPDSRRVAYVVSTRLDKGDKFVVLDGNEEKRYQGMSLNYPVFSPDSKHFAYVASNEGKSFAVLDGVERKGYSLVLSLIFSPDSSQLAYIAYSNNKPMVVINGVEGKQYDEIEDLQFSPDGKHFIYAAHDKQMKKWFVVVNEKEGKPYDFVLAKNAREERDQVHGIESSSLKFDSPDTLRYLAVSGKKIFIVTERLH